MGSSFYSRKEEVQEYKGVCAAVVIRGDVSEPCSDVACGMALVLVSEPYRGMVGRMGLVVVSSFG
jgi:hypothetical protein